MNGSSTRKIGIAERKIGFWKGARDRFVDLSGRIDHGAIVLLLDLGVRDV